MIGASLRGYRGQFEYRSVRLKAIEKYVDEEEEFRANYSDGLTDPPLPQQLVHFRQQDHRNWGINLLAAQRQLVCGTDRVLTGIP